MRSPGGSVLQLTVGSLFLSTTVCRIPSVPSAMLYMARLHLMHGRRPCYCGVPHRLSLCASTSADVQATVGSVITPLLQQPRT